MISELRQIAIKQNYYKKKVHPKKIGNISSLVNTVKFTNISVEVQLISVVFELFHLFVGSSCFYSA